MFPPPKESDLGSSQLMPPDGTDAKLKKSLSIDQIFTYNSISHNQCARKHRSFTHDVMFDSRIEVG